MKNKAAEIEKHFHDIAEGVHKHLREHGIEGLKVTGIHFAHADGPQCPQGTVWKCVDDPQTNGVKCGCF